MEILSIHFISRICTTLYKMFAWYIFGLTEKINTVVAAAGFQHIIFWSEFP